MSVGMLATVAIVALLAGVSKTAIGGLGMVSAALLASALPAKQSTAALLLLLLFGDFYATFLYRQHVDWRSLFRLAPAVIVGVLAGWRFLAFTSNEQLRELLGGLIIILVVAHLTLRKLGRPERLPSAVTYGVGATAGFTSMVANAAGPVLAIYLLNMQIERRRYLATTAWFFLALNLTKLPFSIQLGLFDASAVEAVAWALPLVWIGAWFGKRWVLAASDQLFENLVLASALAGGLNLLLS